MRVLITGGAGFIAGHLIGHLSGLGVEVFASRRPGGKTVAGEKEGKVRAIDCELTDAASVQSLVAEARPDRIFHLAAQSSVSDSWRSPDDAIRANVLPAIHLFEAVRRSAPGARVLTAGSAQEYGRVSPEEPPVREDRRLEPVSPYGVAKAAQDLAACQYGLGGLHVVRVRSFNVIGPGQDERFAASEFARQTARIEAGLQEPSVSAGNLDSVRDFTDARDAARALWLALEKGEAGEAYNLCSGKGRAVREILDFFRRSSRVKFGVELDPARMRPAETPVLVGDPRKLMERTGWAPSFTFEETLTAILEDWRGKVAHSGVQGKG
ncbi:MAG TPA: GDP-mannose 4,6-dehydratase [Candidatus Eisenbacteria bacterium]|nr:GDP-mannose 4,6-dehydratase [Candidatus Eisenbacteria bacterium]